jgi:hypothetical protein
MSEEPSQAIEIRIIASGIVDGECTDRILKLGHYQILPHPSYESEEEVEKTKEEVYGVISENLGVCLRPEILKDHLIGDFINYSFGKAEIRKDE